MKHLLRVLEADSPIAATVVLELDPAIPDDPDVYARVRLQRDANARGNVTRSIVAEPEWEYRAVIGKPIECEVFADATTGEWVVIRTLYGLIVR